MTDKDLEKIISQLFEKLSLKLKSEIVQDDAVFIVNLVGDDTRHLEHSKNIGGSALIYVIRTIAKHRHGEEPRIILDYNSTRQRRIDNIVSMSKKTAELVRVRGGEEELRPMTPAERRAVHMALKEMAGIKTESRGDEPHRRIVVIADLGD